MVELMGGQDDDACLRNVTMQGKFKDGFFVPAGT